MTRHSRRLAPPRPIPIIASTPPSPGRRTRLDPSSPASGMAICFSTGAVLPRRLGMPPPRPSVGVLQDLGRCCSSQCLCLLDMAPLQTSLWHHAPDAHGLSSLQKLRLLCSGPRPMPSTLSCCCSSRVAPPSTPYCCRTLLIVHRRHFVSSRSKPRPPSTSPTSVPLPSK